MIQELGSRYGLGLEDGESHWSHEYHRGLGPAYHVAQGLGLS